MNTIISKCFLTLIACSAAGLMLSVQAGIIIEENFGGSGLDLHGVDADTFDAAITSATTPGDGTWSAHSSFNANGSITSTGSGDDPRSALLSLGSYINDAKNTANGKFILTTNISQPSGGTWISSGFFIGNNTNANFVVNDGLATSLHRTPTDSGSNYYMGPATTDAYDPGNLTGTVIFTTTLDFTPAGGYNGTNNFGTVTFANSVNSNTFTSSYGVDQNFNYIGFSANDRNLSGMINSLQLFQVPEANTLTLVGLALGSLLLFRRRI